MPTLLRPCWAPGWVAAGVLAWAPAIRAQVAPAVRDGPARSGRIAPAAIDADLRFLASDLLEGRGATARGGRLAVAYIAAQLCAAGLRPAVGDTSYSQRVPFDVLTLDTASVRVTASGRAAPRTRHPRTPASC